MKATLLIADRFLFGDGSFAEVKVWRVPVPVPPSTHDVKYRAVYIVDGERVIGFDNERGKGDHQHGLDGERSYAFRSVDLLMADFVAAIEHWRQQNGRNDVP